MIWLGLTTPQKHWFANIRLDLLKYKKSGEKFSYLLIHFFTTLFSCRPHSHSKDKEVKDNNWQNSQIIKIIHVCKIYKQLKCIQNSHDRSNLMNSWVFPLAVNILTVVRANFNCSKIVSVMGTLNSI